MLNVSLYSDKLASRKYTRSEERKGFIDEAYEFVKKLNFTFDLSKKRKKPVKSKSRPTSPKKSTPIAVNLQALILLGTLIPSHLNI